MSKRFIPLLAAAFVLGWSVLTPAGEIDPNLIGWWTLDEGLGVTTTDSSGNGHEGTLMGGPVWTDGFSGTALEFDGADDYVLCAERIGTAPGTYPEDLMPAGGFTVACWVRLNTFAYFSSFVGNGIDTGDDECGFFLYNFGWSDENGQDFGLAIRTEGGMYYVETPNIYETGTWYHLAATYDGQNVKIYVDGAVAVGPEPVGGPVRWISQITGNYPERFAIGVWLDPGYDLWVDGAIDEVRYYSRALAGAEIKTLAFRPKAHTPSPPNGALGVTQPLLQWQPGTSALFHNVYLGTSPELTEADLVAARQAFGMYYHVAGLEPGVTYYWRVDEIEGDMVTTHTGDLWSFTAMPLTAYAPTPADDADNVTQAPTLGWRRGQGATGHHLYFGDSFDAVSEGVAETDKGVPAETAFSTGLLRSGTTYYWRVDETNAAGDAQVGDIWSFTTVQPAVGKVLHEWWLGITGTAVSNLTSDERFLSGPDGTALLDLFEGPVDWTNNYGSRLSGWLIPPKSGEYTFWVASDDASELRLSTDEEPANAAVIAYVSAWTNSREWTMEANQKSEPVTLQAGQKYYIEAVMKQLDRVHPHQDLARGLLGNVQENEGRGGIEQQYEEALRGRAGREIRARNSDGRLIPGKLIEVEPPLPGGELVLTIDRDLQEIGHEALREAIEETGATGGDLLVTDPETGEILAMVSIREGSSSALTAISTPYEPGSTLKPFTVAAILEAGVGTLQDSVDTEDGRWTVAGRTVTDVHATGKITLSDALRVSSNVGVAKIATRLSSAQQYENLRDFGFGVPSGIVLPGEASGTLRRPDRWSAQSPVSLAIGYEIAVTPLQMVMAYGALANGGYLMEPLLVKEVRGPSKEILWRAEPRRVRKVVSETTTRQIARVMVEVVENGTGTAAGLSSFAVAGKSGTSRAYGPGGYEAGDYYSSFVGFFPADEPQLVVYVKIEKPQGAYYGAATAAPVTRATMQAVLAAGHSPLDRRALVSATSTPLRRPYLPTARFASQPLYPPPNPASGPNTGEETVGMAAQVPSVEGLSARVAVRRLHALGYRVLLQTPGIVWRTFPPAGEQLPAGDTVRLETRRGEDG